MTFGAKNLFVPEFSEILFFIIVCISVATEAQVPEYVPTISQVYLNNESLQPLSSQSLNTVCFYCINLEVMSFELIQLLFIFLKFPASSFQVGNVCDTFTLMVDRVWVAHGVHLVGRIMAVLSLQQQTIHIMQISDDGHFTALKQLGKFVFQRSSSILNLFQSKKKLETA